MTQTAEREFKTNAPQPQYETIERKGKKKKIGVRKALREIRKQVKEHARMAKESETEAKHKIVMLANDLGLQMSIERDQMYLTKSKKSKK